MSAGIEAVDPAVLSRLRRHYALTLTSAPANASTTTDTATTLQAITQQTHIYKIVDGSSVESKLSELQDHPEVALAEPNYRVQLLKYPSDTKFNLQWHIPKIAAQVAWDTVTGSKKVKVCILDTGARIDHPDLAANIVKGWNVIGGVPVSEYHNFNDTHGHGTHVSGLAAAVSNNARGVSGVAWSVSLMVCKFITDYGGDIGDAILCMRLCRDEGALIYNNSWGGLDYTSIALEQEIKALEASNGLFVAAAGNDGLNIDYTPKYPASFNAPNQITVAATTSADNLADFSNYGARSVHISAPGDHVLSTYNTNEYGYLSGTSMATPVVSGAAALLQAMALNAPNGTALTPRRVKELLMGSVDSTPWGGTTIISGGRLNVARAVATLKARLNGYSGSFDDPTTTGNNIANNSQHALPMVPRSTNTSSGTTNNGTNLIGAPSPSPLPSIECGTSLLRGQPANQSSTAGPNYSAENAVNGNCRNDMDTVSTACAATDPAQSNAWWSASLPRSSSVLSVSLTTLADCCWTSITGAVVMVGNVSSSSGGGAEGGGWEGDTRFQECGRVPTTGVFRGQRITVECPSGGVHGNHIVVYLPKLMTSLTLCEVDAVVAGGGNGQSTASAAASVSKADVSSNGQYLPRGGTRKRTRRVLLG